MKLLTEPPPPAVGRLDYIARQSLLCQEPIDRLWGYLNGVGLMMPSDDIRAGNPPTNPELLEILPASSFAIILHVEHMLRLICNSRTYQLSVGSHDWNRDDTINYFARHTTPSPSRSIV
ncbi:MAG: DUF1553 domain-containing protein [Pirellulaceae bacterium]